MTDERRAKVAALTHALMAELGGEEGEPETAAWRQLEEWHDRYRHEDGSDVCERLDFRIILEPIGKRCTCGPDGCDEEGMPGCAYCRALDAEMPCPADEGADQ